MTGTEQGIAEWLGAASIPTLLAFALLFSLVGGARRWWVFGWAFNDERDAKERAIAERDEALRRMRVLEQFVMRQSATTDTALAVLLDDSHKGSAGV